MLEISQDGLAELSGVSGQTIIAFENGKRQPYRSTLSKLQGALETAGVEFTNGDQPGVRMARTE